MHNLPHTFCHTTWPLCYFSCITQCSITSVAMLIKKCLKNASLLFSFNSGHFGNIMRGEGCKTIVYDKLTSHWSISFEIKDHCLPRILGGNCLPSSPLSVCHFYYYTPKTLKSISWAFPGNGHGISVIMGFENVIFLSGSAPALSRVKVAVTQSRYCRVAEYL